MHKKIFTFKKIFTIIILLQCVLLYSQDQNIDKLLSLSLEELMELPVLTASKKLQKMNEVAATVRVISAEQIKNNGYFTLDEALADLPGFQFRNIMGFNSYVFQRGVPNQNNKILVLIDGVQINELNSGGFYGGGHYNLSNVDRIEVVYGPASVLYGTNALSGIINILTKNPDQDEGLAIGAAYGTFNTRNFNFSYGYKKENSIGIRFAGMYKTSEKADLSGAKGDYNWSENMENFEDDYSLEMKINYKDFTCGLVYQNKQASRTTNYKSQGTVYQDWGTLWNIQFINSYLKHEINISGVLDLSSHIYYRNASVLDNTVAFIVDTAQFGYYRPNSLIGVESMINYKQSESIGLICGVVFESENLAEDFSVTQSNSANDKPPKPAAPDKQSNTLLSLYLQSQFSINSFLQLTAGARFDNSSLYEQVLTPRAGIVYNKDYFTVKLLYKEAYRAPKPWDYQDGAGNPNLKPEEMRSVELSLSHIYMNCLKLEVSLYKNELYEIISKSSVGQNWNWINSGKLKTNGFETCLEYYEGIIKSYINYTYNYSSDNNSVIPEIGIHNANIGVLFSVTNDLKINLRGNYCGRRKNLKVISATNSNYIDYFFVVHSTISYLNLNNIDFQLVINNLFDTEYYHTSNRPPDRYRQAQRSLILKTEYKF